MERQDIHLVTLQTHHLAILQGDVAVRGPVEPVAPDAMAQIQVVGQAIEIGFLGQRAVEGRVEDRHLGNPLAQQVLAGLDALEVGGVVQGGQLDAVLDPGQDGLVDAHRLLELLAAVHDPVTDGIQVGE